MVRPRIYRRIGFDPQNVYFKPRGIPLVSLEEVSLNLEEIEAIRLNDFLELEQTQCAKKMNISQPTFNRNLNSARKKIADALINGKAIKIIKN